jgi:DUF4097 and DUF4098 domain-containing protein YvlB
MRISLITAGLAILLAACGGDGGSAITEFDDVPQRIEVDIAAGDVSVTGNAATDGVSVETEVDGAATPSVELGDGVLSIADDCSSDCSVNYDILVAGDADVVITTNDGNVVVSNITGTITVETSIGAVTLATVDGDLQVIVGEGDVLGTRLVSDVATFEASEGNVDITFDEVVSTLVVATDKGDVTVQLPDGSYAFDTEPEDRTELRIDGSDGAANTVTLTTGDGEIIVYKR